MTEAQAKLHSDVGLLVEKFSTLKAVNSSNKERAEKLDKKIEENRKAGHELYQEVELCKKAIKVLQKIKDDRNDIAKREIEDSINAALASVFIDEGYRVKITDKPHGNMTYRYLMLIESNGAERSLARGTGHGVKQIISFICNVLIIKFSGSSRILIADELFDRLSPEYAVLMSDVLVDLAEQLDFQFILIEHNHFIWSNPNIHLIRIRKRNGKVVVDNGENSYTA